MAKMTYYKGKYGRTGKMTPRSARRVIAKYVRKNSGNFTRRVQKIVDRNLKNTPTECLKRNARQNALYEYLKGLQTAATSYQRRRQNACRDITDLIAQYTAHRKRKAEGEPAESQESKGSESGDYSSDVPSSDSSDE